MDILVEKLMRTQPVTKGTDIIKCVARRPNFSIIQPASKHPMDIGKAAMDAKIKYLLIYK